MKNILHYSRLLIIGVFLLISQQAYAVRYQSGDFVFDCNFSWGQLNATLMRYVGVSPDVTIPETVDFDGNTYPVLYIGDEFSTPFRDNPYVESVRLPDNALNLSVESFSNCPRLESVVLGRNLERIEAYAFYHCPKLSQVKTYNKLTKIGEFAFAECPSLSSLTLGRGVLQLGKYVFDQTPIQSLTLFNSIPAICEGPLNSQTQWYNTCQVYVHIGSLEAYSTASEWSRFSNIDERAEKGDVNTDGMVDISDVNLLINCILGRFQIDISLSDINQDSNIDIADVSHLINIMLGKD